MSVRPNPVEHDTHYLDLLRAGLRAEIDLDRAVSQLRAAAGHTRHRPRKYRAEVKPGWFLDENGETPAPTIGATIEALATAIPAGDRHGIAQRITGYADSLAALEEIEAQLAESRRIYREHGWERYFLVTSSDGLIHTSTNCSTCNKGRSSTTFALLPTMSGHEVADVVEVVGPALCSVCYPDAPTSWLEAERVPGRVAQILFDKGPEEFRAELAAYKAKKAVKDAEKCSGSGKYGVDIQWLYRPHGTCPECRSRQSVTSTGKVRQHKPR